MLSGDGIVLSWTRKAGSVYEYHIAQSFGGGKPWQITGGLLNFTIQILTMSRDIYNESKQEGIRQSLLTKRSDEKFANVFLCQKFTLYGTLQFLL